MGVSGRFQILPFGEYSPQLGEGVYIAPGAVIIGNVTLGKDVSVWCNAVLRGDINSISIGEGSNIQDNCSVHVTSDTGPVKVGNRVTVGHGVTLHGCTIEDDCLIGMGAVILDGAVIRKGSLVAAGSLVPPGKDYTSGSMILGSPAREARPLTYQERAEISANLRAYLDLKKRYLELPWSISTTK